jgi:hypothetical protein
VITVFTVPDGRRDGALLRPLGAVFLLHPGAGFLPCVVGPSRGSFPVAGVHLFEAA